MEKYNVIIVDDEPLARDLVRKYLSGHPEFAILAEAGDGFEALKLIRLYNPALVFLDIQMPKIDGFELLEILEVHPEVVFATAFDQFAIRAFEMNAVDYLLKPFSKQRFDQSLAKVLQRLVAKNDESRAGIAGLKEQVDASRGVLERVVTRLGSKVTVIPVDKISHIEAQDDYVMIHSELGNHLKEKTMKYFEDHLPADTFVRIHRSSIINITRIASIELYSKDTHLVTLRTGEKLKASAEGYKKLRGMM